MHGSELKELAHRDNHINANSTNNTGSSHRQVEEQLGTENIHLGAHLHEDSLALVLVKVNAIGILVKEGLAGFRFTEEDVGNAGRGNVDAFNSTPVNQRKNLGRNTPRNWQSLDDDATNTSG